MTEAEWLTATDPRPLLAFLGNRPKGRKPRLFAAACCRRVWPKLPAESCSAVEAAERLADGFLSQDEWKRASKAADTGMNISKSTDFGMVAVIAVSHACSREDAAHLGRNTAETVLCAIRRSERPDNESIEREAQAALVREVYGNPFRPVALNLSWQTDIVLTLAQQMYESREFSAMPILADALQDAGCDNEDVLNHCRDAKQPHVRGCWVVDLVLGKA